MYTLKSIVRKGTLFGASAALLVSVVAPSLAVFATALNPLTERSLLLTSSAPGYQDTDGSGYATTAPNQNPANDVGNGDTTPYSYAVPGSGPNGKKTGQTFTFKTSSSAAIEGFSFQYCTTAAGYCQAPGDNEGDDKTSTRETNAVGHAKADPNKTSDLNVEGIFTEGTGGGQFQVTIGGVAQTGWEMAVDNLEDDDHSGALTGKNNYVTLTKENTDLVAGGTEVQIKFVPNESVYITNPGSKEFFVKINTYSDHVDLFGGHNEDGVDNEGPEDHTVIDGGVTVANVMTDSIHITTKVLETMAFSVGTRNRDTVKINEVGEEGFEDAGAVHGTCDAIQTVNGNRLNLGDPDAEYSLQTGTTWDVYSYWRLSSNSSGGATVYYSGNTLANTVGDEIAEIGASAANSTQGTDQFGLAFVDATTDDDGKFHQDFLDLVDGGDPTPMAERDWRMPSLTYDNLAPLAAYANGTGAINGTTGPFASFAFEKASNTVPRVIAQNNQNVIRCATAKMRYIANIAADTPAGVYTTKINYLAAPQY